MQGMCNNQEPLEVHATAGMLRPTPHHAHAEPGSQLTGAAHGPGCGRINVRCGAEGEGREGLEGAQKEERTGQQMGSQHATAPKGHPQPAPPRSSTPPPDAPRDSSSHTATQLTYL